MIMIRSVHVIAALIVLLMAGCGDKSQPALLEWFTRSPEGAAITVHFTTGWCDKVSAASVDETKDQVLVTIPVETASPDAPCESIAPRPRDVLVNLKEPLGSRAVRGPRQAEPVREHTGG
jgi:hypothetical protein